MNFTRTLLAATAGLLATSGLAGAADLYPVYGQMIAAPELTPVEIGNGWYLRGDVSYDLETEFDGSMTGIAPTLPAYDLDDLRLENGYSGGIGIGYRLNDFLRVDATARYGKSDLGAEASFGEIDCQGFRCSITDAGETTSYDLMANAYLDLGTFAGLTPYVGAGAGAYRLEFEGAGFDCEPRTGYFNCPGPVASGTDSWRFAYALSAGIAYDLTRSLKLDIGYRYLNVDGGEAYTVNSTSAAGDLRNFTFEDDGFDRHTIQAGLRYSLW